MKDKLHSLFSQAIETLKQDGLIPADHQVNLMFERTRQKEHGDFATNVAMTLAKAAKRNPREIAQAFIDALPEDSAVQKVEIAGPGFINVFLASAARYEVLDTVFNQGAHFGLAEANSGKKILLEFVSANPTGPLHVGHGRGAAYGDALAKLLSAAGNQVHKEYYVNDAGRQMDILATSVWIRFLQSKDIDIALPDNAYQGDYILDIAASVETQPGYVIEAEQISAAREGLDDEAALDATIALAKSHLQEAGYKVFFDAALDSILADIRDDLSAFGVDYNEWFSERSLFTNGLVENAIADLNKTEYLYEKGGATWFKSTDFGDEKDRVVVRDNGQPTYFASDIAYHKNKLDRGFDQCINIWGSDHHGYIPRVKAAMQALGLDENKLTVLLVQFAVLYRGGEKVPMSTRSGKFVELKELREEVGADACRFFYIQRKSEQHMDFDLDLAKSQSNDNPMYYVQYAHARICSIFAQAKEREIDISNLSQANFSLLDGEHENQLLTLIAKLPEVIQTAARDYEPHQITYYLRDVATAFHSYYNSEKFLDAQADKRLAMLALIDCARQILANGLTIIGVDAPEKM